MTCWNDDRKHGSMHSPGRRKMSPAKAGTGTPAEGCGAAQSAALQSGGRDRARLHPNDTQRAALKMLQTPMPGLSTS